MKTHTHHRGRRLGRLLLLLGLVATLGLLTGTAVPAYAHAATTLTVTNCSNDSQLQADVNQANNDDNGDIITFACSGDILLTGTLNIEGRMTIDGSGQSVTLDGQNRLTVFVANYGFPLTLNALTIANGSSPSDNGGGLYNVGDTVNISNSTFTNNSSPNANGGGLYNYQGTVSISNSTFTNNSAASADGGGLYNYQGTVSISNSTFTNNSAPNLEGGGLYNNSGTVTISSSTFGNNSALSGGGLLNEGTVTISNSTFANNSAGAGGGGLYNRDSKVTISNSTFASNSASNGGGLYNYGGTTSLGGSIVAKNTGGDCSNYNGTLTDNGYNLSSDSSCGFTGTGDLQNTDPLLDPLGNNGGPTQTMALQRGSPAIDQVPAAQCPSTDQRGVSRLDNGESSCDMGAYESSYDFTVTNCSNDSQLQADVNQANQDNGNDRIIFSCSGDIPLTQTLTISGSMTIDGSGQHVSLDGQNQVGVFSVNAGVTLTLNALTIAHGSAYVGGGLLNEGTVTISNSTFANNSASSGGGGLYNYQGTVTISNSTFASNSASNGGGLLNTGTATISNSTFASNSASSVGGGLYNNGGTATISSSTFASNSASNGGGLYNYGGTTSLGGSIVAKNTGSDCFNYNGTLTDNGYNLSSDSSCGFTGTGDLQNTDPLLDPNGLQNNGGPTQTIALEPGSPASDQVPLAQCPSTDQRGVNRPDDNETACDMGAYESNYTVSLTLNGTSVTATEGATFNGVVASGSYTGNGTLSATIDWGDGSAPTSGTISGSTNFTVSGSHSYAEEGSYTITITVTDGQGQNASATSPATVGDAALTLTQFAANPLGHHRASLSATFTDADPNGQVSDYTATINWGDGMSSTVKVGKAAGHPQGFDLGGLHTYAKKGTYTLTLTVVDQGGSQLSKTVSIKVV